MPLVPRIPDVMLPGGALGPKEPGLLDKGLDLFTKIFGASAAASQANSAAQYQMTVAAQAQAAQARTTQMLVIGGLGLAALFLLMKD